MSEKYNGWSSYATWRVNLEICDDLIQSIIGEQTFTDESAIVDWLKESVDEALTNYGENETGLALDYARSFCNDVDYWEIAHCAVADNPELFESDDDDDEDDSDSDAA